MVCLLFCFHAIILNILYVLIILAMYSAAPLIIRLIQEYTYLLAYPNIVLLNFIWW